MQTWLKRLTLFLMVLALPMQGMAASTMRHGGVVLSGESLAAKPATSATSHPCHAGMVSAAVVVNAVEGDAAPDVFAGTSNGADTGADKHQSKSKQAGSCSACASCCPAAAWFLSLPSLPAPELLTAAFAVQTPAVPAMATGGPDRPPRSALN